MITIDDFCGEFIIPNTYNPGGKAALSMYGNHTFIIKGELQDINEISGLNE